MQDETREEGGVRVLIPRLLRPSAPRELWQVGALARARGEDGQPLSADTSDGLALRFDGLMLAHFLANGVKGEMEGDDE